MNKLLSNDSRLTSRIKIAFANLKEVPRQRLYIYLLIIAAVSALLYANTLKNEFVSDDLPAIVNNPDISKTFAHLEAATISLSLNYHMGWLNPFIYHLTNIFLHVFNSIIVFFFLALFLSAPASFWGALIFAAHPVNSEAVTWISARGYLFFLPSAVTALFFYILAANRGKLHIPAYMAALFFYAFSLSSAVFAFVFPGIFVLYDFTFGRWKKNWPLWLGFFCIVGVKLWLLQNVIEGRITSLAADMGGSASANVFFNMAYSLFSSFWLFLWPRDLTLYHEPNVISQAALTAELVILGLLLLVLPLVYKKAKALFFAICFYVIILIPTYSSKPICWLIAERYLYLPAAAFSLALGFGIDFLYKRAGSRVFLRAVNIFLVCLLTAYSWRTFLRNSDWKNHEVLWIATARVSPLSPKAHNNMGDVYSQRGDLKNALKEFARAIELKPGYADAYHNLAYTYQTMARLDKAVENYRQAIYFNPALYQSYLNLGVILYNSGNFPAAKDYLSKYLTFQPGNIEIAKLVEGIN